MNNTRQLLFSILLIATPIAALAQAITYEYTVSTNRRYLHNDHQGSIIAVSNPANSVLRANTYDTYGIPHANNLGRFSYTGQLYLSEIGLHYYKARIYSASYPTHCQRLALRGSVCVDIEK